MSDFKNNQSISKLADQLVRYYRVPFRSAKEDALNTILEKIENNEKSAGKKQRKISWIKVAGISAAATIAILITFWFFTASVTYTGSEDGIATYRLPDNSRIILYKNSKLSYKKMNWNRKVNLQGQAYFEVQKGDGFQVKTKLGQVEVLGTRFLVSETGEQLKVQCFQGKVKTSYRKNSWVLEPGTQFVGEPENTQKEEFEKSIQFPDFAKFNQSFSNAGLADVVSEIETFFNVEIEIKSGKEKNFTGTIQTGNLENTLEIVCESLQLKYSFNGVNQIIIFKSK